MVTSVKKMKILIVLVALVGVAFGDWGQKGYAPFYTQRVQSLTLAQRFKLWKECGFEGNCNTYIEGNKPLFGNGNTFGSFNEGKGYGGGVGGGYGGYGAGGYGGYGAGGYGGYGAGGYGGYGAGGYGGNGGYGGGGYGGYGQKY